MARPKPRRSGEGQAGQVMRGSGHIRQTTRDRCVRIRFLHAYELSIIAKTGTTATKNLEEDARTHHPPPEPPQLPKGCKRTKAHAATASQAYSTAPCGVASVRSRSPASFNVVREKVELVRLLSPMWFELGAGAGQAARFEYGTRRYGTSTSRPGGVSECVTPAAQETAPW